MTIVLSFSKLYLFLGSTTYVLSLHQGVYNLWNAHTGEKFTVDDAYCPLQDIACLINGENVRIYLVTEFDV